MPLTKNGKPWNPASESDDELWTWDERDRGEYRVSLRFASCTSDRPLPAQLASLPVHVSLNLSNLAEVRPQDSFDDIREKGGVWRFCGWSPESRLAISEDLDFTGTWIWEGDEPPILLEARPTVSCECPNPHNRRPLHAKEGEPSFVAMGSVAATTAALAAIAVGVGLAAVVWVAGKGNGR